MTTGDHRQALATLDALAGRQRDEIFRLRAELADDRRRIGRLRAEVGRLEEQLKLEAKP